MGKSQRDKGNRVERHIVNAFKAHDIEAQRVPLSGMTSFEKNDVQATIGGNPWSIEVKARASGFKQLYAWLEKDNADALVIKADRKQALVVLPLNTFAELAYRLDEREGMREE